MSDGSRSILAGIRPLDGILAAALTVLGVVLMVANVLSTDDETAAEIAGGTMVHPLSSHSWLMIPVFALATVAVLWWRRSVPANVPEPGVCMENHGRR